MRHRRLEVTLAESALCTTAWRREQSWYTEAGTSSPGRLPYWMHRGGQGGMRREESAGADYQILLYQVRNVKVIRKQPSEKVKNNHIYFLEASLQWGTQEGEGTLGLR